MSDPKYFLEGKGPQRIVSREREGFLPEDVCVGCNLCELACSLFHEGVVNPRRARIQIHRELLDEAGNYRDFPVVCRQCEDVFCVEACPVDCFEVNPLTGTYDIIEEECIGCVMCVEACPWGEIYMDMESGVAIKCDLCGEADSHCVQFCPSGVLRLADYNEDVGMRPIPERGGMAY